MEWDASMETGDPTIDAQHRRLFGALADIQLLDAANEKDAVQETLEGLADYIAVHFALEEGLMTRVEFPPAEIERHVAEHRDLTERTRAMILDYRSGALASIAPLCDLLTEWLTHHVIEMDQVLADHVRSLGS